MLILILGKAEACEGYAWMLCVEEDAECWLSANKTTRLWWSVLQPQQHMTYKESEMDKNTWNHWAA